MFTMVTFFEGTYFFSLSLHKVDSIQQVLPISVGEPLAFRTCDNHPGSSTTSNPPGHH